MASRLDLQKTLESVLGSRNVYYQPPASVQMKYPAIVYSRRNIEIDYANNAVYKHKRCYEITLIGKNPDSVTVEDLLELPYCRFDRHYVVDNINHDTFIIYY